MKIKSISAQRIYRLKVSGRPVPSQPGLDEVITDDRGGRMFVCSDTDFCEHRRSPGGGSESAPAPATGETP